MINDTQAGALRPRMGWLRRWCDYAVTQTDAPAIYHLATGLSVLSTVVPPGLYVHGPGGFRVQPNLYCLFVGRSTADRKSTSIRMAPQILGLVGPHMADRLGAFPMTAPALVSGLQERPIQLWTKDEFSTFLSLARGNSYAEPVKTKLTEAFDGGPLDERTQKSGSVIVSNYRVSLNAGCSLSYLQQYITPFDMTGGFFARFLIAYGARERFLYWSRIVPSPEVEASLAEHLGYISMMCPSGEVKIDPEGMAVLEHFGSRLDHYIRFGGLKEAKQGGLGRAEVVAVKIATLIAADWHVTAKLEAGIRAEPARGEHLTITGEIMQAAISLAWAHVRSIDKLVDRLRTNEFNRAKDVILDLFSKPGVLYDIRRITNAVELGTKKLHLEILDMLTTQGLLVQTAGNGNGGTYWSRSEEVDVTVTGSLPTLWTENITGTPVLDTQWFDQTASGQAVPPPMYQSNQNHAPANHQDFAPVGAPTDAWASATRYGVSDEDDYLSD